MTEFKKGQRVKVEFEGVVDRNSISGSFWVRRDDGTDNVVSPETCKVTPLSPKEWPPRVGDIWEAEGVEWFAGISEPLQSQELVLTHAGTRHWIYPEALKLCSPVLVRRRRP